MGFSTMVVRGKGVKASENTFLSVGLPRPRIAQLTVQGHALNENSRSILNLGAQLFTTGQLSSPTAPHYVQLVNGSNSGLVSTVTANGSDSLTLTDNLQEVIVPGETVIRVHPYWTLGTLFPSGAPLGGGLSPASADTITIIPPSGITEVYFYSTAGKRWQRGLQDASHTKISPGMGMMVTRKRLGDVSLTVAGEVSSLPVELPITATSASSRSLLAGNPFPVPLRPFRESGLYTGNSLSGLAGGLSPASADNITVYSPTTGLPKTYYYHTASRQWRSGLLSGEEDTVPAAGTFVITRKANRPAFSWYIPPPPMILD